MKEKVEKEEKEYQRALELFAAGFRDGMKQAYENAARLLYKVAREAPIPDDFRPGLRLLGREIRPNGARC